MGARRRIKKGKGVVESETTQEPEAVASLLPQHAALIRESAIAPRVAAARGYRSVESRAELERLGFSQSQRNVPCLLIPIHDVHGELATYQIRPDTPRVGKRGRVIKYETPRGARMILDVPPPARAWIADPKRPLFITEGARKADSAVSKGICCVAILGVWNWRGTNEHGGQVALADWEDVALKGRDVYIAFDSDVTSKPEVFSALSRFRSFLGSRGARAQVIYLPTGDDGTKIGLDDFLAGGHSTKALVSLASSDLKRLGSDAATASFDTSPYLIESGRLCVERQTREGPVCEPLCNFVAKVTEEIAHDDGVDVSHTFTVEGTLDNERALPAIRVPADRFSTMSWVTNLWGLHAVVRAGQATKDRLREGIQRFSGDASKRHVYVHTGWREVEGQSVYLTGGGGVGRPDLQVELSTDLARYSLPTEPVRAVQAMRTSVALFKLAPMDVIAPLWAAVFRAVLGSALPLDLSIWVEGVTGSLKSTLVALFLSHWGRFSRTDLPASWSSTINLLEKRAFVLKDAMFVIDDYAPTALDRRELEMKAARLLRSQGNLAGRGRLRADLTERTTYAPRGLIVGTGEQRPSGQSILARTFPIEMDRSMIRLKSLSAAQAHSAELPHALAGYVRWLAPQMSGMPKVLQEKFAEARARPTGSDAHLRTPEALAHLWLGLDYGLSYAEEIGACERSHTEELRAEGWEAMIRRARVQASYIDEEKPVRRFLEILTTLLDQRRILILPKAQGNVGAGGETPLVGWHDSKHLYLLSEAVYQAVSRFARESGDPFGPSQNRLHRELASDRISLPDVGRTTASVWIGDQTRRVLRLSIAAVEKVVGAPLPLVVSPYITVLTGPGK